MTYPLLGEGATCHLHSRVSWAGGASVTLTLTLMADRPPAAGLAWLLLALGWWALGLFSAPRPTGWGLTLTPRLTGTPGRK